MLSTRKLKSKIKRKGLTQGDIAKKLGVTKAAVSRWVTGNRNPKLVNLQLLCGLLRCKLEDLVIKGSKNVRGKHR